MVHTAGKQAQMSIIPPSGETPGNDERMAADAGPSSAPNQEPAVLESNAPLSQSLIWRRQQEFYVQRGLKAWTEDNVPQFITNNPFIAEIYARIVFNFLCECIELGRKESQPLSPQNPLRILELGAGPGKFSYLFLRHLTTLLRAKNILPETVRYCMTDCSQALIQSWRTNSYLAEFAGCGMLEFELLQAGEEIQSNFAGGKKFRSIEAGQRAFGADRELCFR
jgi:hypothetical protein